jgi:hypothetical protein
MRAHGSSDREIITPQLRVERGEDQANPWLEMAGMWEEIMAEKRRSEDVVA